MPYPSLTFATELDQKTRQELEQFISLLQGYLQEQHEGDGSHKAITADSLAATGNISSSGGTGSFAGNVTADSDGTPVVIGGAIGTSAGNDGLIGPGIDIGTTEASADPRIRLVASGGSTFKEFRMLWTRGAILADVPMQVRDDTSLGGYALMPGKTTNVLKPCYLGSTTDSFSAGRWTNAFLVDCNASAGYTERGRSARMGEWTNVAYAAGNFTTNTAATWTVDSGDQLALRYTLVGKTLILDFQINASSVSAATPAELRIAIPGGFTAAARVSNVMRAVDNGTERLGEAVVLSGNAFVGLYANPTSGAAWAASANNTGAFGQIAFEIQ